jgi:hypothetical protein
MTRTYAFGSLAALLVCSAGSVVAHGQSLLQAALSPAKELVIGPSPSEQAARDAAVRAAEDRERDGGCILRAVDNVAAGSLDPERKRGTLLARLTHSPMCFPRDLNQEQFDAIMRDWQFMPPGLTGPGGVVPRFNVDGTSWVGDINQGTSGRANSVRFTYSFPADGATWGLASISSTGPNTLNASLTAAFGATNRDRGREYFRQSLAAWKRYGGMTYQEVADSGIPMDQVLTRRADVGDIRIGGRAFGTATFLAYNAFPSAAFAGVGGGDMCMNTSFFLPGNFLRTNDNYRYLRNTVAHEHGHGVGCIHQIPCNQAIMMEPQISTNFDVLTIDDRRAAGRNYGDRFAGNQSAGTARDFGNLTATAVTSVIERDLSTNGTAGANNTDEDWFRFTTSSFQNVVITAAPTGGSYVNGQQSSGCTGTSATVNAQQAGNLNVEVYNALGTGLPLFSATTAAAGSNEVLTLNALAAGTYTVRIVDVGPNAAANELVQLYDLTIRVGTSTAPPYANAGINKICFTGFPCFFMGDINSAPTETGSTISSYAWDTDGNGSFETAGAQPNVTYTTTGDRNVTLRVTDSNGRTRTDTIVVSVVAPPSLTVSSVAPSSGAQNAIVPVTINGAGFTGVTSTSQITVSGAGVSAAGTPVVNGAGTQITGLSLIVGSTAATGARDITINSGSAIGTGVGVFTVTPAPTGACCAPAGTCTITTSAACAPTGGTWQGAGTVCSPNPCSPVTGACCVAGNCSVITPAACSTAGGTYFGNSSICTPSPCAPVTGACCATDGSCSIQTSADCSTAGGTYQGNATVCTPNPCPQPTGACCATDGSCSIQTSANCTTAGGTYQGNATVCTPNPCPQPTGACCSGVTCSVITQALCVGTNRSWVGPSTVCNVSGNNLTPCCRADFNRDGTRAPSDIFAFLNAYFSTDVDANAQTDTDGNAVRAPADIFAYLNIYFAGGCP